MNPPSTWKLYNERNTRPLITIYDSGVDRFPLITGTGDGQKTKEERRGRVNGRRQNNGELRQSILQSSNTALSNATLPSNNYVEPAGNARFQWTPPFEKTPIF